MKHAFMVIALLTFARGGEVLAQCQLPFSHDPGPSICFGYAMARAWGCNSQEALAVYPIPTNIHSHSDYFTYSAGSNFNVGDIIIMGPENVPVEQLNQNNGHAAYVAEIQTQNTPDGPIRIGPTSIWRDDDENTWTNDSQVILEQVLSQGSGFVTTSTLAQLKAWRPNDIVKGHYKARKSAFPYTVTVQNSFSGGQVQVGQTTAGTYLNFVSPFSEKFPANTLIKAKVISPQTVSGTTWAFDVSGGWSKNTLPFASTESMQDNITQSATYEARFAQSSSGPMVIFQNYSDGVPIGSIIKVNGVDRRSPSDQFPLGANALAYSSLFANRVQYQFAYWSTSSTNPSLTPVSAGTYTAHYNFQYVLEPGNIYVTSTGPMNNIQIRWDQHPSPYVTQYQVWRKVRHVHPAMVIATLPVTATSFTDDEYSLQGDGTQFVIEYDLRARYVIPGVRDVYSSPFWFSLFGFSNESGAVMTEGLELLEQKEREAYSVSISPNPFNPSTVIAIGLEDDAFVEADIYDLQGRLVSRLFSETRSAGRYSVNWTAKDGTGRELSSGMYILRLRALPVGGGDPLMITRKLLLMK